MSKIWISILAGVSLLGSVVAIVTNITSGSSNASGIFGCAGALGIIAWFLALREAWFTRAWGWLLGIFFTGAIGALAWGMLGPGKLAPLAEQKLRALRNLPPQAVGIQAPAWTPELVKSYLELQGFVVQDDTLRRALSRMHWLVD